ncbi:MAG: inositol monophosphatase family protein [Aliarcobacter sp.]|nr:inositol monophosphatase family protein [Aliarcobacter sp.]
MNKNITALYKKSFIEAVILANKELHTYINTNLSSKDYEYTNTTGFGGDNSLKIDLIAENIFIKYLEKFGNIYSEECGLLSTDKEFTIVIDPLDGSNNFYSRLPYYGTSVALKKDEITIAGFVTNLVTTIITYRAFEDEIKQISLIDLNEIELYKSEKTRISIFERAYEYPEIVKKLFENRIKFRSLGAVALSLCDAKKYDFVLYGGKIRDFDIAAALYICNDLYVYQSSKFLLISKNADKYKLIKEFIKEE